MFMKSFAKKSSLFTYQQITAAKFLSLARIRFGKTVALIIILKVKWVSSSPSLSSLFRKGKQNFWTRIEDQKQQ